MADPSPIQQLQQRQKALADVRKEAAALPAVDHSPKARKDALLKQIDDESKAVNDELALSEQYRDSTTASADDPDPGPRDPAKRAAWAAREKKRADERAAIQKQLDDLKKKNPSLYTKGDVADPCVKCRAASVAAEIKWMNKLAKVEILDGFDTPAGDGKTDPILTDKGLQWVNLQLFRTTFERAALPAWLQKIDSQPVNSFDRLSRTIRVRVEFTLPGEENFKIKLVPGGRNLAYTAAELGASGTYKPDPCDAAGAPVWLSGKTDADGKKVVTMRVRTTGGDRWHVIGIDDYNTQCKSSGRLATVRGLFVCKVMMANIPAINLSDARAEFRRQKIHLEIAELTYSAAGAVPYRRFMYCNTDPRFNTEVTRVANAAKTVLGAGLFKGVGAGVLAPYLVVAHFYDMSPKSADTPEAWIYNVSATGTTNVPLSFQLWDPTDAANNDWFVSVDARQWNGTAWVAMTPAPTKANFTPVGTPQAGYTALTFTPPAAWATSVSPLCFQVTAREMQGAVNGFSFGEQGQKNFVAIARRSFYQVRDPAEMNQTIAHEIGHKVNFSTGPEPATATNPVANAGGANSAPFRWLDASPTHYIGRGHVGGHCFNGAKTAAGAVATTLQANFSTYKGVCVMFGQSGSARKINFCSNCSPRMKKLDIEMGWPAL